MGILKKRLHGHIPHMPKDKISDEDKALFRANMADVQPLSVHPKASIKKIMPQRVKHQEVKKDVYPINEASIEPVFSDTVLSYYKNPIPMKRMQQLKKGMIPCEGRLDLHGLHVNDAWAALSAFIEHHYHLKHRCLLIIHGKGGVHGEPSILKNQVNQCLQQRPEVLAFHSADAHHGGTGALYVLLKHQEYF